MDTRTAPVFCIQQACARKDHPRFCIGAAGISHASTRLSLSASISSITSTVHGPPIQALQVVRGADVKLDFVLKVTRKEAKVDKKNLPMSIQILEHLNHLKSQHCRSMFNSTTVHVHMCQFPLSFCP